MASVILLLLGASLEAQQRGGAQVTAQPGDVDILSSKAPYRLVFDPLSGGIELQNQRGSVVEHWDRPLRAPLADIPNDRPVNVVIANANPLLYEYSVNAQVIRQEEIKSCRDIGSRFLAQGFLLSSAAVGGVAAPRMDLVQPAVGSFSQVFSSAATGRTRGALRLSTADLDVALSQIRPEVNDFTDFTNEVIDLSEAVNDSLASFAEQGERVPLDSLLSQFQASLDARHPGLSDPRQTFTVADRRVQSVAPSVGRLKALVQAIESGEYEGGRSDAAALEAFQLEARVEAGTANLQSALPQLQNQLLRVERVRADTRRAFALAASEGGVRRLVIKSTKNNAYSELPRFHEGEVEIYTRPRRGLVCEISLGVTWLEPLAEYDFDRDGTLIDNNKEDRRVAPAVMMHVSSPSVPFLGFGFGVGIGKNHAPDLYLGGSLRMLAPILINVGWVWQRTPQLPSGMRLGDLVANPDPRMFDDPDFRFERSLYFGIGIGR